MNRYVEQAELDGRPIAVHFPLNTGEPLPVLYMLTGSDPALELSSSLKAADKKTAAGVGSGFAVIAVGSKRWNSDYTPWPAPSVFQQDPPFDGGAKELLAWLTESVLPWAERRYPEASAKSRSILGYSLAGLAALYAMYAADAFDACGCCSGSLWYDGWLPFMQQHHPHRASRIYLSLGRSEEKTRNPRMAAIGEATREAAALLAGDPTVSKTTLTWHDGGHFTKIPERIAGAMRWLTSEKP